MFRHGSRSLSPAVHGLPVGRHGRASEASAANHHPSDSSGGQNRYEPSPNILSCIPGNASQKVELQLTGLNPETNASDCNQRAD